MRKAAAVLMMAVGLCAGALTGPATADDVTDAANEAMQQYQAGNLAEAASGFEYAAQLIRQRKADKLNAVLPEALPGWEAEEVSSSVAGAALFGGGVSIERRYVRDAGDSQQVEQGESSVTISVTTDSPMLQGMMMAFSNPMFATAGGGRMETIAGQKAIVKYQSDDRTGEVTLVVRDRFLVSVSGYGVEKKDLTDYAAAVRYVKFAEIQ